MSLTELQTPAEVRQSFLSATFPGAKWRVFDITFAALALVMASPIIILVIGAIWLETGRPFLFSQIRLGHRGKPFRIYKFRKFYPDNSAPGCPLTVKNDSRMTPVGRFLEKTKLDELPQFWNVLRGDMSIVGPRPETPNFADCFESGYARVLDFRPGLLGPSQTFFRYESSLYPEDADPEIYYRAILFPLIARIDLAYYPNSSLTSDITWIVRCILEVLGGHSTCPPELLSRIRAGQFSERPPSLRITDLTRMLVAECEAGRSSIGALGMTHREMNKLCPGEAVAS